MIINIKGQQMEGNIQTRANDSVWNGRESKAITIEMSYAEAVDLFESNTPWSVVTDVTDENDAVHQVELDMSEYAISGPITDNRDGTVTIRMGKYRSEELMLIPLEDVPASLSEAVTLRSLIETAVQSIESDLEALSAKNLHPAWEKLSAAGAEAKDGMRFTHGGKLYKVIAPHAFAPNWVPGSGTESLYACIDESHAGTLEDPIPYDGNMALEQGLYYSQYGVIYLCIRNTGNPVHNTLSSLVGLYVEAVG